MSKYKEAGDKKAIYIQNLRDHFAQQSKKERGVWLSCYKNYIGFANDLNNPYFSNLFIPKTHEAVEMLASFLVGKTQTIDINPKSEDDVEGAEIMKKLIKYQWDNEIKARPIIITWIKQAILFGNGIMKVSWEYDEKKDNPLMWCVDLSSIYMDYYTSNIQETEVIHRIIKRIEDVKNDTRYNQYRLKVTPINDSEFEDDDTTYSAYDNTNKSDSSEVEYTEILEYWSKDNEEIITVAPTSLGWQILDKRENKFVDADNNKFKPFVKIKFKNSPLPNRAYDIGAIEPTLNLQLAFNDAVNQFFDNTKQINEKMWIKRKSANIDPKTLVRRPGGIIEVNDINADIRSEETSDIKQSMMEMLQLIDNEFQQASMVTDLMKGLSRDNTATETAISQQNALMFVDMVDQNIKDAFSELGKMIVNLNIQFMTSEKKIKLIDNEKEFGFLTVKPSSVKGSYDVEVFADRKQNLGKAVEQKQLLDFLAIMSNDPVVAQQYPEARIKIYKKWLENAIGDAEFIFENNNGTGQQTPAMGTLPTGMNRQFNINEGLEPNAQELSSITPSFPTNL